MLLPPFSPILDSNMSLPKTTSSYPVSMIEALQRAHAEGEVIVPTLTPAALRLQFQGLRGALRKEGRGELADMVSFFVEPDRFIIRLRANLPGIADLDAALARGKPLASTLEAVEASLDRILSGKS